MFVTPISVAMSRFLGLSATIDGPQLRFQLQCLGFLEFVTAISTTISTFLGM